MDYETLKAQVQALHRRGAIPTTLTREQRIEWAYGHAVIENPRVTVEMVTRAVDAADAGVK